MVAEGKGPAGPCAFSMTSPDVCVYNIELYKKTWDA